MVTAEPYHVPSQNNWVGHLDESVAIYSPGTILSIREWGRGFGTAVWGGYALIGVYFSPNRTLIEFRLFLSFLGSSVRRLSPFPIILLDPNAKSSTWAALVTTLRGLAVEEWAIKVGLSLGNNTYVRAA